MEIALDSLALIVPAYGKAIEAKKEKVDGLGDRFVKRMSALSVNCSCAFGDFLLLRLAGNAIVR